MSIRDIDRSKKAFTLYSEVLPVLIYTTLKINKKNLCTSFQSRSMFLFEIQQFELPSFHSAWHHNRNAISLKKSLSSWFSAVWPFQVLEVMFMHTYASSRVKRNSFYTKSELRMFLLISGSHIGAPKRYINMASPYKALQSCVKHFGKQQWLRICGPQRSETWTNCLYTCIGLL